MKDKRPFLLDTNPDRTRLADALGFSPPEPLFSALQVMYNCSRRSTLNPSAVFRALTGHAFADASARYPQTPAELFPFACLGVDGVHVGYVIHAPELAAQDYPVGSMSPMDWGGVFYVGRSTSEAFQNLISDQLAQSTEPPPCLLEISAILGISPDPAMADGELDAKGMPVRVDPQVPSGWDYLRASDGIGVLAPVGMFAPHATPPAATDPPQVWLQMADSALVNGFPATALWLLREVYWRHWSDDRFVGQASAQLAATYRALGRHSLATLSQLRAAQALKAIRRRDS